MSRNTLLPLLMYVPIVLSFAGDASLPFRFKGNGFIRECQTNVIRSHTKVDPSICSGRKSEVKHNAKRMSAIHC